MGGVLFVNQQAGPAGDEGADEFQAFRDAGLEVETMDDPAQLPERVAGAIAEGRQPIGAVGGDGSLRSVAEVAAPAGVTVVVVPGGTRNHFAKELGLTDFETSAAAVVDQRVRLVSLGWVNGRCFMNNASVGIYPALVRRRDRRWASLPKTLSGVVAAWSMIRDGRPIFVRVDGKPIQAWLVFVGNGRYGVGFPDLIERRDLDEGILDLRVVTAERRLARVRIAASLVLGRLQRSPLLMASLATSVTIEVDTPTVDVALDGEVINMQSPLEFVVQRSALQVLGPPRR